MSSKTERVDLTLLKLPECQKHTSSWERYFINKTTRNIFLKCHCNICQKHLKITKSNVIQSLIDNKFGDFSNFIPKCTSCVNKEKIIKRNKSEIGRKKSKEIGMSIGKENLKKYCLSAVGKKMLSENGKKTGKEGIKYAQRVWIGTDRQKNHIKELGKKWGPLNGKKFGGKSWKSFKYDGHFFQSTWEKEFYDWLKNNNIKFIHNNGIKTFLWVDCNGKSHYYYPDFHLVDFGNVYVDTKNKYLIEVRDKEKIKYITENYKGYTFIFGNVEECILKVKNYL